MSTTARISMYRAPVVILLAAYSTDGTATVPTTAAPVMNLLASTQPPSRSASAKKRYGIGTKTYANAVSKGHQLWYRIQP